jgi:DNA mismatch repair ATPase MutL
MLAIENVHVLQQNGFDIVVNDDEDRDYSVPRISLVGQPISKDTVFDTKGLVFHFKISGRLPLTSFPFFSDLEELLHLMQDRPIGQVVRCSKVRTMLAMRACRKSIMVGLPLNHKQMTQACNFLFLISFLQNFCCSDLLSVPPQGLAAYEQSRSTVELSAWKTNHASLV